MESEQSSIKPNQFFHQYVHLMESEVGCTGKSLHEVLSSYLRLKSEHSNLAARLEDLEISSAEVISSEQYHQMMGALNRLQVLQKKILQSGSSPQEHPWYGIAHFQHNPEEFDPLNRMLRFVLIHLNKLWVEIQSVPLFLNTLGQVSLVEMQSIFEWVLSSPDWTERISQPKVIPGLVQLDSRKMILDFARDVRSLRLLREKLEFKEDKKYLQEDFLQSGLDFLSESTKIVSRFGLHGLTPAQIQERVQGLELKQEKLQRVLDFFLKLSEQCSFPNPKNVKEASKAIYCSQIFKNIDKKILSFRYDPILSAEQRVQIEEWKERARPLLEIRAKIVSHFSIVEPISSTELRKLVDDLTGAGALRTFNASYQAAVCRYQNLLKNDGHDQTRKKKKEPPVEMSARLLEWADYLDQVSDFEKQEAAQALFGIHFQGIDTDFQSALQVNRWVTELRRDLEIINDTFGNSLFDFMITVSASNVDSVSFYLDPENSSDVRANLLVLDSWETTDFGVIAASQKMELTELGRLLNLLDQLSLGQDIKLSELEELRLMTEEFLFLTRRMDSNSELKQWLRVAYRGVETDLSLLDQSLAYVQYIESSKIPQSLKNAFHSAYGPQRLNESRELMSSVCSSLEALKESLQKLEGSTYGQTQNFITFSIPSLMNRIQVALRKPALIQEWVEYSQCERDVYSLGLRKILDHYEKNSLFDWPLSQVFDFAFLGSLLKKAIQKPLLKTKEEVSTPCLSVLNPFH